MTAISLDSVSFSYPRASHPALSNASLQIAAGELLCLVGPSGCGKTTLLKLLSGLLTPDSGRVRFGERDVTDVPPERRLAAMVFQNHLLFPFMSVLDNVGFAMRMRGDTRQRWVPKAMGMLDRLHLSGYADRRPGSLSGGQQQRVALARALVADPAVLLLDEPLSNLDRHLREDMRRVIIELQRETGVTTVCVTHDQEEAVLLGDRIAMLSDGRVVQVGTAEEFYERPVSAHVARFFGNANQMMAVREGDTLTSSFGTIRIDPNHVGAAGWPASGTVCLHVRPESIRLRGVGVDESNSIQGRVIHSVYVGTHMRYVVDVGGEPWQVASGSLERRFVEGEAVSLIIPADRIWLTRE